MNYNHYISLTVLSLCAYFLLGCQKTEIQEVEKIVYVNEDFDPGKGVLNLTFNHHINGDALELSKNYSDANGNTYAFDEVRYWVSNIKLVNNNGEEYLVPNSYYLIENRGELYFHGVNANQSENHVSPANKRDELFIGNIPLGNYNRIKLAIGVDSKYNDNFALKAGELDINQMSQVASWAWNTSYIFWRTKGSFMPAGQGIAYTQNFVVETGGNDLYREIELQLPQELVARAGATSKIDLSIDVLATLQGMNVNDFSGQKAAGWSADPNLSKYTKFVNGSSVEDMKIAADNLVNAITIK